MYSVNENHIPFDHCIYGICNLQKSFNYCIPVRQTVQDFFITFGHTTFKEQFFNQKKHRFTWKQKHTPPALSVNYVSFRAWQNDKDYGTSYDFAFNSEPTFFEYANFSNFATRLYRQYKSITLRIVNFIWRGISETKFSAMGTFDEAFQREKNKIHAHDYVVKKYDVKDYKSVAQNKNSISIDATTHDINKFYNSNPIASAVQNKELGKWEVAIFAQFKPPEVLAYFNDYSFSRKFAEIFNQLIKNGSVNLTFNLQER
jgi:hypothetical protein